MRTVGWPARVAVARATASGSGFTVPSAVSYQRANCAMGSRSTSLSFRGLRAVGTHRIVPCYAGARRRPGSRAIASRRGGSVRNAVEASAQYAPGAVAGGAGHAAIGFLAPARCHGQVELAAVRSVVLEALDRRQ